MKKRWIILAGVLVILLAGGAVWLFGPRGEAASDPALRLGDPVAYVTNTVPGLSMEAVDGTVRPTGMIVRLTNATDTDYTVAGTETGCGLNVERGGVWYGVEANRYSHTAEWNGWRLEHGASVEQALDWEIDYDALPKGHYRAVRSMGAGDAPWPEDGIVRLSAEFYIE